MENTLRSFVDWKNGLSTVDRGVRKMYDVKGYYKYLLEEELFDFYTKYVNNKIAN